MQALEPFQKQNYINVETYRKTGVGVRTPVWFVQDDQTLYVRTMAESGKVKRIRTNRKVKIAPCKMDGALIGEWVPATAREVKDDKDIEKKVDRLLDKKYGLMKKMYAWAETLRGREYTILEVNVSEES